MLQSYLPRITRWLIYIAIVITPLFYLKETVYPYLLSKTLFFQLVVEVVCGCWLICAVMEKKYRPQWTPITIGVSFFITTLIITALLGVDLTRSFWSTQERAIGVFLFLHVGLLFLVISTFMRAQMLRLKPLLYTSLGVALVVDTIAFLQLSHPTLLLIETPGSRPGATFGNPTFLAGYLVFHLFLALYLCFLSLRSDKKDPFSGMAAGELSFSILTIIMNTVALLQTQTRGDILGVMIGGLVLAVLFLFRPPTGRISILAKRSLYAALLLLVLLCAGGFWFTRNNALWENIPGISRFRTLSLQGEDLIPRLAALSAAWRGFQERPIFGWGWENFNIVFNKYYDPHTLRLNYQETRFDKPHNIFAEYLVTGGIVLFAAFVTLVTLILWACLKIKDKLLGQIMAAAVVAYLVRSFFVFDTIGPLMMFFICVGIIDGQYESVIRAHKKRDRVIDPPPAYLLILLPFMAMAYLVNLVSIEAASYQFRAFQVFVKGKPVEAIGNFRTAIEPWSPYQWNLKRDYATAVAEAYFNNPGLVKPDDAVKAVHAMEEVAAEHPLDAYNHYALVDLYNQIVDIDKEKYLDAAEREGRIALELSPNRQEVMFSLAKTKSLRADYKGALAILRTAIDLDPKVADGHFYYGLIAFADGNPITGYKELKTSIDLGRRWKNANEPRVVGNFFANSGHLDEAIELYKVSLSLREDLETEIKLAIAYYFGGKKELAREKLRQIARTYDFTKSTAYPTLQPILRDLGIE